MVSSTTTALATRIDNDLAHRFDEAAAEEGVTAASILERAAIYYKQKNPERSRHSTNPIRSKT